MVSKAVNLATVEDVLAPVASGFAIISNGGVSFSNVTQVHVAPLGPVSKSIGFVCENFNVIDYKFLRENRIINIWPSKVAANC